jgi:heme/copper-type cytochrome/quinol oxidase subunit 2
MAPFALGQCLAFLLPESCRSSLKIGHKDRPLDKFPDSAHPTMTPAGIVRTSQEAQFTVIAWTLVLIIFLGLVLVGVYFFTVPG